MRTRTPTGLPSLVWSIVRRLTRSEEEVPRTPANMLTSRSTAAKTPEQPVAELDEERH